MFAEAAYRDRPLLIVSTETVPGYVIEQVLGLVVGSSYWTLGAARRKAVRQAERMGANAWWQLATRVGAVAASAAASSTARRW